MLLYLLDKVAVMLNHQQIYSFFNKNDYADFFKVQELLSDLTEAKLIELYTTKTNQKYKLTEDGKNALKYLKNELSKNELDSLDKYIEENKLKIRQESSLTSDYSFQDESYNVNLIISENDKSLLNINIDIPDEEIAITICDNWKNKAQDIYNYIIKQLV